MPYAPGPANCRDGPAKYDMISNKSNELAELGIGMLYLPEGCSLLSS